MDYRPVVKFLKAHERFIITAHETPDGDALGAEYAMLCALRQMGKTALIFNGDPAPAKFTFFDSEGVFTVLAEQAQLPADLASYVLLVLDVNDLNNIGQVAQLVLPRVKRHFIIDHHDSESDVLGQNHVEQNASSTCEVLCHLFGRLGVRIDLPMAQALFMGISYDTGSFVYPKTTASTFQIARELVEIGVNPNEVYSRVYESNSTASLMLMSRVLGTLELHLDRRVAVQTMTAEMVRSCAASYDEGHQLINIPLRSAEIRVSIFFKENLAGLKRCSLRSKGNIDVASIAQSYGGGGHKTAAGFKCPGEFAAIKGELLERLAPCLDHTKE